ncbi:MAG: hypothetical protein D6743_05295 [Calditrichaeota bacterium]|nr:MAG: hypothetical protein D6743_05295 [Calditrichota bacterium]
MQKLTHRLENNLSMPVSWFDLMIPLEQFGGTGDVGEFHHWFSISTLLGMTRARDDTLMDLRPEEERKRQRQRAFKRRLTGTALILLYIFALSVAAVKFSLHQRHGLLAQLQTEVAALRPKVQALKHLEEAEKRLRQQLGSTKRTSALLAELLQKLPPSVQLNSLSLYRGEKLLATGVSDRLDDVLSLPQLLDAQPDFDAVELTSVDRRQRNGRQEIYFEIKVNFSTNED